jgi:hypothetical protein
MLRVGRKHGNDDRVGTFPHHADHFAACRYCRDQRLGKGIVDRSTTSDRSTAVTVKPSVSSLRVRKRRKEGSGSAINTVGVDATL